MTSTYVSSSAYPRSFLRGWRVGLAPVESWPSAGCRVICRRKQRVPRAVAVDSWVQPGQYAAVRIALVLSFQRRGSGRFSGSRKREFENFLNLRPEHLPFPLQLPNLFPCAFFALLRHEISFRQRRLLDFS